MKITLLFFFVWFICFLPAKAQTVPSSTGSNVSQAEAMEALQFHNNVRSEVGVGDLEWSAQLAAYAQAWADHLASENCKPQHRPRDGEWKQLYGENIFWGTGPYFAVDAAKMWYGEKKDYTYGPLSEGNWYKTGHYTQLVWRNTSKVGMGVSKCPNGTIIIVANYDPPGNMMGQKPY